MQTDPMDLSTGSFDFGLALRGRHVHLTRYGLPGGSWLHPEAVSGLFSVIINGRRFNGSQLTFEKADFDDSAAGVRQVVLRFGGPGFVIEQHIKVYRGSALVEMWPVIRNSGEKNCRITRVDSFSLTIPPGDYQALHFTGDWGREYEPIQTKLADELILESRSGRSSKGSHPWFALSKPGGEVLSAAVVWSGNWVMRFEPLAQGGFRLSGGLHDWRFAKDLPPGGAMEAPPVVLAVGATPDDVSQQYARIGRAHWYPRNRLSSRQPVEWNHWWPYQDYEIDEATFEKNVLAAVEQGMEVCTLDAGWFGLSEKGSKWYELRGDWHLVNRARFPKGIRHLSDFTHAHGMSFGLWCEIEGLGIKAQLAVDHPDYVATRKGKRLNYVCFGNPAVQEWAYQTLARLIQEYNCDWIKLDFNLDPGSGCDRSDHGHGPGDGLFEHYQGYYRTLERLRRDYPEVVLENCSSGGLRIDLGIMRHTDMTFLSDPDWPVHDLQIFWGASQMLAPDACLHWGFCEWLGDNQPAYQNFNPRDPKLTRRQLDYYTRISMLGLYGFSQKLPDYPDWVARRLATHTGLYKEQVRRFVGHGELFHLTGQPRRSGEGERWAAFQYSLAGGAEHLLFVFRLPGAPETGVIYLAGLEPARLYTVVGFEGETGTQRLGAELMTGGLRFDQLLEEDSALLRIY